MSISKTARKPVSSSTEAFNRRAVANIARGRRVLDCFTHTGSFALNAAAGGAEHVHAVDISQLAVDMAESNARLNGFENRMSFQAVNVFDLLPEIEAQKKAPYDFIILDPPAFTKSRKTIDSATRGYHEINYRAMKALPRGDIQPLAAARTSWIPTASAKCS